MTATARRYFLIALLSPTVFQAFGQDTRAFNQNASRSNHTRLGFRDDWTFSLNSGLSFTPKTSESNLFRGNGLATKFSGDYFFGQIGLGFSAGMSTGSISKNALNDFLVERKLQQANQISKSNPFNSFFLVGPSIRAGQKVVFTADIRGGIVFNDPGAVTINLPNMDRPAYAFQGGEKKSSPGYSAAIKIAYPISHSTSFFIGADYLQSKSDIRVYDPQSGIDIPVNRSRNVKLASIGAGISKSFGGHDKNRNSKERRKQVDNASWQDRSIERDNGSSTTEQNNADQMQGSNENIQTSNAKHAINTKGTGATNGRMSNSQNCGPVTLKSTGPDGTVEEKTFQCPADAAAYTKSIQQPENAKMIHRDLAARNVISGRLSFGTDDNNGVGIITNRTMRSTSKQTQGASFGEKVKMGIRETTQSGEKKYGLLYADQGASRTTSTLGSVNENVDYRDISVNNNPLFESSRNSGVNPTGNRHNTNPLFEDKGNAGTNPTQKSGNKGENPLYEAKAEVKSNPLYNGSGTSGTNPLSQSRLSNGSDGLGNIEVELINTEYGVIVASTETNNEGEFFFANVPDGDYTVRLSGQVSIQKGYELNANSTVDLLGVIQQADHQAILTINTNNNDENQQRAGISTSRSNVRTRSLSIIDADTDGDGQYESMRVMMGLTDGSTVDVTNSTTISKTASGKKVTVRGWDPEKKKLAVSGEELYTINITEEDISLTKGTSDISVSSTVDITRQDNIVQVTMMVEDQKIKTKSNIKNDRVINPNIENDGNPLTAEGQKIKTKSNIKNDRLINPNIENDGNPLIAEGQKIKTKSNIKNDRLINPNNENGSSPLTAEGQKIKTKSNIKNDRLAMPGNEEEEAENSTSLKKILPISNSDMNGDGEQELLVGGIADDASTNSARPGTPIGGIIVKGGKNPGGNLQTILTNNMGEFQFSNWGAGSYLIIVERKIIINDETRISVKAKN